MVAQTEQERREKNKRRKMKLRKKKKVSFGNKIPGVNETQSEIEMVSNISGDDRASFYSMSNGILPALGAESTRKMKLNHLIISPFSAGYRSLFDSFLLLFLICYACIQNLLFWLVDQIF